MRGAGGVIPKIEKQTRNALPQAGNNSIVKKIPQKKSGI
jgi:hypothetical protein